MVVCFAAAASKSCSFSFLSPSGAAGPAPIATARAFIAAGVAKDLLET